MSHKTICDLCGDEILPKCNMQDDRHYAFYHKDDKAKINFTVSIEEKDVCSCCSYKVVMAFFKKELCINITKKRRTVHLSE